MLQNTPYAQRPYDVFVQGPQRTVELARRAALEYVDSLEQQLGSTAEVVRCFRAWELEITSGILAMSRAEIEGASAWRTAHCQAFKRATRPPMAVGELEVVFRLK